MICSVIGYVAWSRGGSFLFPSEAEKCEACQDTGLDTCPPDVNVAPPQLSNCIGRYGKTLLNHRVDFPRLSKIYIHIYYKYFELLFSCPEHFMLS